jgi:hypothetical protein
MSKKADKKPRTGARRKRAQPDLTTRKGSSVGRADVTGGGKTFLIFVQGPNGRNVQ